MSNEYQQNEKSRQAMQHIPGAGLVPSGKVRDEGQLYDWHSFANGAQNRDEARTNLQSERMLSAQQSFIATRMGIHLSIFTNDIDNVVLQKRLWGQGICKLWQNKSIKLNCKLSSLIVMDENGSLGAAGGTVAAVQTRNGMPHRLTYPITFNPMEDFYVELHWEQANIPQCAANFTFEVTTIFDGVWEHPIS